jgi:hypothetical protein
MFWPWMLRWIVLPAPADWLFTVSRAVNVIVLRKGEGFLLELSVSAVGAAWITTGNELQVLVR